MRDVLCAALATAIIAGSAAAAADDIYVPGDADTVAGGLALAAAGDRVYVGEGIFTENFTVPAGVGLYGSGPEVSILDGGGNGTVIDAGGDGVVISGFSIRNAGGAYPDFGITVYGVTGHGGHAHYLKVPARTLVPLPDELSFEEGAAVSCGTGTAYGALRRMGLGGHHTLAVFGQGPVGLSATLLGAAMGADPRNFAGLAGMGDLVLTCTGTPRFQRR